MARQQAALSGYLQQVREAEYASFDCVSQILVGHQSTIAPTPPLPPTHRPIVSVHKSLSTSPIETETTGLGQANTTTTSAEDSCVDQLVEKEGAANTTTIPSALHSFVPSFNSIVQVFQSRWARIRKIETETVKKEGLAFIGTDPKFCGLHEVRKEVKVRGRMEERFVRRSARINSNLLLTA